MFCKKCGHQLENENASYCSNCGAPVKGASASSTESLIKRMQAVINIDSRKKVFIALAIAAVIIIFAAIKLSVKSDEERIVGTWEEYLFETKYGIHTYEKNEGDKVTFGKNGKIIDADQFLGLEFGWSSYPVDILSWDVEDDTLIFYIEHGDVEYVPYTVSGKKLTLYFEDERKAELYKIK